MEGTSMTTYTDTDLIRQQHDKIAELEREWRILAEAVQHLTYRELNPGWHRGGTPHCPGCMNVQTAQGIAASRNRGPDDPPEDA
jgi:hypothetical protein